MHASSLKDGGVESITFYCTSHTGCKMLKKHHGGKCHRIKLKVLKDGGVEAFEHGEHDGELIKKAKVADALVSSRGYRGWPFPLFPLVCSIWYIPDALLYI